MIAVMRVAFVVGYEPRGIFCFDLVPVPLRASGGEVQTGSLSLESQSPRADGGHLESYLVSTLRTSRSITNDPQPGTFGLPHRHFDATTVPMIAL
jgi:hypothetical protein